jgi:hypothetical protein
VKRDLHCLLLTFSSSHHHRRINKEGGCAKITKIHYSDENNDAGNVEGLDVKYVVSGGTEKNVDPSIVSLHELLDRGGRKRRGREFLMERADDAVKKLAIEAIKKKNASKSNKNKSQKKGGGTLTKKKKQQPPEQQQAMESSPGPTSPSTPVTPDHKPKVAKKQVTVTSIPSYVNIGDGIVEVSPLPVDRSCMAKSKPAVARRGLFGGGSEPTIANNHQKSTSKSKSKVDCVVAESTKKPAAEKKKMYAKSSTFGGMADKPTTITPGLKKKAPSKPQATNASNTAKIARRDVVESKKPPAMKQPLLQFPRPKPANHASKEGTRKPLKEVYEDEVKKAKKFLDDVMGARADDIIVDESKENKSAIMDEKKPPS